jgi:hypothetical protein
MQAAFDTDERGHGYSLASVRDLPVAPYPRRISGGQITHGLRALLRQHHHRPVSGSRQPATQLPAAPAQPLAARQAGPSCGRKALLPPNCAWTGKQLVPCWLPPMSLQKRSSHLLHLELKYVKLDKVASRQDFAGCVKRYIMLRWQPHIATRVQANDCCVPHVCTCLTTGLLYYQDCNIATTAAHIAAHVNYQSILRAKQVMRLRECSLMSCWHICPVFQPFPVDSVPPHPPLPIADRQTYAS